MLRIVAADADYLCVWFSKVSNCDGSINGLTPKRDLLSHQSNMLLETP